MKKIIFTIAITLGLAFGASAQSDGFFSNWQSVDGMRTGSIDPNLPEVPNGGLADNQNTPLGTGLLILTALGAGYAVAKRRSENS